MKSCDHLQTMAFTYQEILKGITPWVALGNFMNDWFDYAKERRVELVAEPIVMLEFLSVDKLRWAVFCAASVEWLCERYAVPCPSWVDNPFYCLSEPWFDCPNADNPQLHQRLIEQTPEPFTRRNIFCGNRMFANKYELVEALHLRRSA